MSFPSRVSKSSSTLGWNFHAPLFPRLLPCFFYWVFELPHCFSFVFLVLNCGLPDFRWARSDSSESNRVATNFPSNRLGLSVFVTFFKQFFLRYHRMELIPCISLDLEFFRNFISIFSSSTRAYWVLPSFT